MQVLRRWRDSFRHLPQPDLLTEEVPSSATPLRERVAWLGRLIHWVRASSGLEPILHALDRNPESKARVSECLRSILRDTEALELFMHAGIPNQPGFVSEFIDRVFLWLLPQTPNDRDLESIFSETFRFEDDAEWIERMDPIVFQRCVDLFRGEEPENSGPNRLLRETGDALFLLSHSVRSAGLSRQVRNRVEKRDFRSLPFFELPDQAKALIDAQDPASQALAYGEFSRTIERCFVTLNEVYAHYREHGASIDLVYSSERLRAQLKRCRSLGKLLFRGEEDLPSFQRFFALLVRENARSRKIRKLLTDNLELVSRKIIETNAETGEHYITRDSEAYFKILKKSWGGGAITGFTTLFKFLLQHLTVPPFFSGIFAFANYSVSFLVLQALGFTLATKQPAMTATVLAAKMDEAIDSVDDLVDEIVFLVRSQLAAVVGNLTMVVPVVMLIDWVYSLSGSHLIDEDYARYTMDSFSFFGMTPLYAAGTGVLLWLSSVFAGWFGNWFNFRGLPEAIEHSARVRFVFGTAQAERLGAFLRRNVSGVAASLSLAFLLGMSPQIASFFGFPFDVRHVTLSSGALTASGMAIGASVFSEWRFWHATLGILSMAILNLAVSFALALFVAIWAKKVSAPKRSVIYRALFRRLLEKPWVFLIPRS